MDYWQSRRSKSRIPQSAHPAQTSIQAKAPALSNSLVQRLSANPNALLPDDMRQLQSTLGNRAVNNLLSNRSNLTVGPTNDSHEQAADRVARQFSGQGSQSTVQREAMPQVGAKGGTVDSRIAGQIQNGKRGGQPVPDTVRRAVEGKTGADFSSVRVHADHNAQEVNQAIGARAFTQGNHIFLGEKQSPHDVQLMAHELTHTIQQGAVPSSDTNKVSTAKTSASTIQRDPGNLTKAEKAKVKQLKAEIRSSKAKVAAIKSVDFITTLPLQVIDELSIGDRHIKDFVNFARSGGKTRARRHKEKGYDKTPSMKATHGDAVRGWGRTGLRGYLSGYSPHQMVYGSATNAELPWHGKYNPFTQMSESVGSEKNIIKDKKAQLSGILNPPKPQKDVSLKFVKKGPVAMTNPTQNDISTESESSGSQSESENGSMDNGITSDDMTAFVAEIDTILEKVDAMN